MPHRLVIIGEERFADPVAQIVHLVSDEEANNFLNNLEESSYAFVLACLMDRQIKAERAWIIPFKVC